MYTQIFQYQTALFKIVKSFIFARARRILRYRTRDLPTVNPLLIITRCNTIFSQCSCVGLHSLNLWLTKGESPTTSFAGYLYEAKLDLFFEKYQILTFHHFFCSFGALSTFFKVTRVRTLAAYEVHLYHSIERRYIPS